MRSKMAKLTTNSNLFIIAFIWCVCVFVCDGAIDLIRLPHGIGCPSHIVFVGVSVHSLRLSLIGPIIDTQKKKTFFSISGLSIRFLSKRRRLQVVLVCTCSCTDDVRAPTQTHAAPIYWYAFGDTFGGISRHAVTSACILHEIPLDVHLDVHYYVRAHDVRHTNTQAHARLVTVKTGGRADFRWSFMATQTTNSHTHTHACLVENNLAKKKKKKKNKTTPFVVGVHLNLPIKINYTTK